MEIKNIIFDLGGVLVNLDTQHMQEYLLALGIDPSLIFVRSDKENTSTFGKGLSVSSFITDYMEGKFTSEQFIEVVLPHCAPGTTFEQIIDTWDSCLSNLPVERLHMIKSLRAKGYGTYLLSNINDLHWNFVQRSFFFRDGLRTDDLFDHTFLSHEMHLTKPSPEIYRTVLRTIGCKAEECFFIDDSQPNVEGARNVGLNAEWLDPANDNIIDLINRFNF